jgi:hypothetical protein
VDLVDHLGSIASIVSLPAAVITVWAALRSGRNIILWIALPVAIAAYTLDVGDRLGVINLSEPGELVLAWGGTLGGPYMTVNSRKLLKYKDHFKMMLILEIPYANIDPRTDTSIDRSGAFTITGDPVNLAIAEGAQPTHLRVDTPPNAKVGDLVSVRANWNLVLIPNDFSPEQIASLQDVERLGGKIVATVSTNANFIIAKVGAPPELQGAQPH